MSYLKVMPGRRIGEADDKHDVVLTKMLSL